MKNMFCKFAFVGILNLGLIAFAEDEKAVTDSGSEELVQVVCPACTGENCEDCNGAEGVEQSTLESAENK